MDIKHCPVCSQENMLTAKYCMACSEAFPDIKIQKSSQPTKKNSISVPPPYQAARPKNKVILSNIEEDDGLEYVNDVDRDVDLANKLLRSFKDSGTLNKKNGVKIEDVIATSSGKQQKRRNSNKLKAKDILKEASNEHKIQIDDIKE